MKVVVVGLGYVGLSNAVLLAQHNNVVGVDISQTRVDMVNARKSPFLDCELVEYLAERQLNLSATTDFKSALLDADYVIVATPTNYDEKTNYFDTTSVELAIAEIKKIIPNAAIVIKSTVPVGFVDDVSARLKTDNVIFSPEFLREGRALYDNLYPSRIIVGEKSERAENFAKLLSEGAIKTNIETIFTSSREAEAIKLFSNTYLAMRVAFFNELDSYALATGLNSLDLIQGVSSDPRIGDYYNNPSFGYGGYCLPKDTKQLLANFSSVPQVLIGAIVEANSTRMQFITDELLKAQPKTIGVYRLGMKLGSDNFRESSTLGLIERIRNADVDIIIYEPDIAGASFHGHEVVNDLHEFESRSCLILANRTTTELAKFESKLFTRDVYGRD